MARRALSAFCASVLSKCPSPSAFIEIRESGMPGLTPRPALDGRPGWLVAPTRIESPRATDVGAVGLGTPTGMLFGASTVICAAGRRGRDRGDAVAGPPLGSGATRT